MTGHRKPTRFRRLAAAARTPVLRRVTVPPRVARFLHAAGARKAEGDSNA